MLDCTRRATGDDALGRVIVLNGTSSSGKSTLLATIQDQAPTPWLGLGIDAMLAGLPQRYKRGAWPDLFSYDFNENGFISRVKAGELAHRIVYAMHRAVAFASTTGIDVLVDHVLLEACWYADLILALRELPHMFIAVNCPLDVLERREAERGDRTVGQARAQLGYVHEHGTYDMEINTADMSPAAAADAVLRLIAHATYRS